MTCKCNGTRRHSPRKWKARKSRSRIHEMDVLMGIGATLQQAKKPKWYHEALLAQKRVPKNRAYGGGKP